MSEWMGSPLWWAVALAAGTLLFKLGSWYTAVNSDRDSFKAFMKTVQDKFDRIDDQFAAVHAKFDQVHASIEKILHRLPAPTIAHSSPLSLTDLGQEVSQELDARGWAERAAPGMAADAKGMDPYTIQQTCFDRLGGDFDFGPDLEAKIRSCAYERGIDREQVVRVFAIELRDKLLEGRG